MRNAMEAANRMIEAGHAPFVPHLYHFQHLHAPHCYGVWTGIDNAFVAVCDALYRLPGQSCGADAEWNLAMDLNIPCFDVLDDLLEVIR